MYSYHLVHKILFFFHFLNKNFKRAQKQAKCLKVLYDLNIVFSNKSFFN